MFDGRTAKASDLTSGRVLLVALLLRLNVLALTLEGTVVIVVADVARVWLCLGTPTNVLARFDSLPLFSCIWMGRLIIRSRIGS